MPKALDNQTLLYIIIAICIIHFFAMRYYVRLTIKTDLERNNKKIVKKLSGKISSTFDRYMGTTPATYKEYTKEENVKPILVNNTKYDNNKHTQNYDEDSIEDPAEEDNSVDNCDN